MTEDMRIPDQILYSENLCAQTIDAALARAGHRILIFDQDVMHGNFASSDKYAI
jgi:hypothetical protein